MISRRLLLTAPLLSAATLPSLRAVAEDRDTALRNALADLERRYGGRLGVAVHDLARPKAVTQRGDERFPLCSTYKFLAAAYVLARVDQGQERLDRRIIYSHTDLVSYSPVTEKYVDTGGLTLGQICEAAVTLSDNTAGNLLLDSFGGPAALTAYLRTLGDTMTRLDRREPELNEATPGDPRDTTSPNAMLGVMRKTVLGNALSPSCRAQLTAWLVGNKTGAQRIRAGVPAGWRVGDKTGSGAFAVTNDIAVLWPPDRAPILVTVYYTQAHGSDEERNLALAEVGRLAAAV